MNNSTRGGAVLYLALAGSNPDEPTNFAIPILPGQKNKTGHSSAKCCQDILTDFLPDALKRHACIESVLSAPLTLMYL